MEWYWELDDFIDFLDIIKVDLFGGEVYVFIFKGDLKVFFWGVGLIDFVFVIYLEVGYCCFGVKVNGMMVLLSY